MAKAKKTGRGSRFGKAAGKNGTAVETNATAKNGGNAMRDRYDRGENDRAREYDRDNEEAGREWDREGQSQGAGRSSGMDDEDAELDQGNSSTEKGQWVGRARSDESEDDEQDLESDDGFSGQGRGHRGGGSRSGR